jgi:voltage-gated potassium channel
MFRKRLYEIIEIADEDDFFSKVYDIFMMFTIIASIIPMCFINQTKQLVAIDKITAIIFIFDYLLRLITADFYNKKVNKITAFILYPFKPMAIIDMLSILPSLTSVNHAFRMFKLLRLFRTFRVFKFFRYSKNVHIIYNILIDKKDALLTVCALAFTYVFTSALIVFQVEPQTFGNLFKAIYWAMVSLTTVGYGDIYPVSDIGRIISMISSFLGIAVVALPSGIIISGYQEEIEKVNKSDL